MKIDWNVGVGLVAAGIMVAVAAYTIHERMKPRLVFGEGGSGGVAISGGNPGPCVTVKGQKGVNGGGDGGDATICGDGLAMGGRGGSAGSQLHGGTNLDVFTPGSLERHQDGNRNGENQVDAARGGSATGVTGRIDLEGGKVVLYLDGKKVGEYDVPAKP